MSFRPPLRLPLNVPTLVRRTATLLTCPRRNRGDLKSSAAHWMSSLPDSPSSECEPKRVRRSDSAGLYVAREDLPLCDADTLHGVCHISPPSRHRHDRRFRELNVDRDDIGRLSSRLQFDRDAEGAGMFQCTVEA